ncbi:acetate--CoA ligase family protein [Neobacillus vireti]|uniref:acetate--CoA ligase family protein n=1 Tax=Neobacillus vireti TaxID=220686 RepID=UPI0030005EF6
MNDPNTDIIIFTEIPSWAPDSPAIKEFIEVCKNSEKFVMITPFPLGNAILPKSTPELIKNGIPVVPGNLNPIKALANLVNYSEKYWAAQLSSKKLEKSSSAKKKDLSDLLIPGTTLSESQACEVLERYGIPTTKRAVATSPQEAVQYAKNIGYPVVLKIDSPDILHKTEADAIRLNLSNDQEVADAFLEIKMNAKNYKSDARIYGVSVQEMLPQGGVEVIAGVSNDPVFGPVIMFGLGGIFVEVFKDISFRVAPITRDDAVEMMEEIKGHSILKGTRGKPSADIDAVVDVLEKLSALVSDYGDKIDELDINPLIVYEDGLKAADALIVVKNETKTSVAGR